MFSTFLLKQVKFFFLADEILVILCDFLKKVIIIIIIIIIIKIVIIIIVTEIKFSMRNKEITSWKARAYGIFLILGEVSEIELVSAVRFLIIHQRV